MKDWTQKHLCFVINLRHLCIGNLGFEVTNVNKQLGTHHEWFVFVQLRQACETNFWNVIQTFIDDVTSNLSEGNEVVLRNFGTFQVMETKAKIGRNPRDPEKEVTIPPRAVVKFRPGKEMKEKVAKLLPAIRKPKKK